YNDSPRVVLRTFSDFGFTVHDLVAPPRRLMGSRGAAPLVETNVDSRRVSRTRTPASWFNNLPEGENWPAVSQRTAACLFAVFLVSGDPQRRLEVRKAATLSHQVSLVQHIIEGDNLRRVLIADEVGLGKTIEAGLLIKQVIEQRPNARILYLAPA